MLRHTEKQLGSKNDEHKNCARTYDGFEVETGFG